MYYLVTACVLVLIVLMVFKNINKKRRYDSALKRRAVLHSNEQIMLARLQAIFPKYTILAQVSFDALLTTKYAHTRRKYQTMVAGFVVLDMNYHVVAIVEIDDEYYLKRIEHKNYQDSLLELAGYRVLRYHGLPDQQELHEDLICNKNVASTPVAAPQYERSIRINAAMKT